MKFGTILLGFVAGFFIQTTVALQKTEEEAHQFLIDQGQVTKDSTVDSFTLDRNGQVRIRLTDGENVLNYGLEENQDTYDIVYMNRRKQATTGSAGTGTTAQRDQLAKKIGQNVSILKGGKVVDVRRPYSRSKSEVEVQYKLGTKTYTITGHYSPKSGELFIRKVLDGVHRTPANSEL